TRPVRGCGTWTHRTRRVGLPAATSLDATGRRKRRAPRRRRVPRARPTPRARGNGSSMTSTLPAATDTVDVEIVIPVYNEEQDLAPSVLRLHTYLQDSFPFSWQLTIADNASTDRTWQ